MIVIAGEFLRIRKHIRSKQVKRRGRERDDGKTYANEFIFHRFDTSQFHLEALNKFIGCILGIDIFKTHTFQYLRRFRNESIRRSESQISLDYFAVFWHCEERVSSLLNVFFVLFRPFFFGSTRVIGNEQLSARFQPTLRHIEGQISEQVWDKLQQSYVETTE